MKYLIYITLFWLSLTKNSFCEIKIVDGDSLEENGKRIRLLHIDAPEYMQECHDFAGDIYHCGEKSTNELLKMTKAKEIICEKKSIDIYKRDLSVCFADGENINLKMLEQGFAVLYRSEDEEYVLAEKSAKNQKKGLWQGKFMKPELYRALNRK